MAIKTRFFSYRKGPLCKGCKKCVKGEKLVLFITGKCSRACFYCPLSEKKRFKDVIYANEWPIKNDSDEEFEKIIKEAKLMNAKGAGITGGDPLLSIDRTVKAIKLLKNTFGKGFHIHLYSTLRPVTKENLKALYEAGLDEIRFHPKINDDAEWGKLNLSKKFDWKVGVEIPAIPLKNFYNHYLKLLNYLQQRGVQFLNINELEYSDTNGQSFEERGLHVIDDISYAIEGSKELALDLMKKSKIPTHVCTAKLKDKVQLGKRIKRRAKNAKKPYDKVDSEGILTRGAIYLDNLYPKEAYRKKLDEIYNNADKRRELIEKLENLKRELIHNQKINNKMIEVDRIKLRLLTSENIARRIGKSIYYKVGIVMEYPTWDQLELEVDML